MRGQLTLTVLLIQRTRIIPARAGPTSSHVTHTEYPSDHPRSCGANYDYKAMAAGIVGSSPLVRGQHVFADVRVQAIRIIPARAGPTTSFHFIGHGGPDHPRSCGANMSVLPLYTCSAGSSPLVRGQPDRMGKYLQPRRIIPARAGPTFDC